MEIIIKGDPEILTDLARSLKSIRLINDLLEVETIKNVYVHYDQDVIIINLE